MNGAKKMAEIHHGMANINEQVRGKKLMFEFKHPKYYKEIRKKNLTNKSFSDKEDDHEKIQNKNSRSRNRSNSNNTIQRGTNDN